MHTACDKPELKCDLPKLWNDHQQALLAFIRKRVKDADAANDILSEVLEKVYNFCLQKTGIKNVRSWLFQIAHNTIVDYYNSQKHIDHAQPVPELVELHEQSAYDEAQVYILPLINLLPEEYAVPLRMADIENKKQAEIAALLKLSLTATKSRIQRARQLLKAEIISCCRFEVGTAGNLISFEIKENCKTLQQVKASLRQR